MNRFMSFFLALTILLSCMCISSSAVEVDSCSFDDVFEQDYFYDAVRWAVKNGVTGGVTKTLFKPSDTCSRAQVLTFLWRANGEPEPTSTLNSFKDVKETDYFYKPVLWAVEKGITGGVSADLFAPSQRCTRAHALTFLWRSLGSPELENESLVAEQYRGQYFDKALQWADYNDLVWDDVKQFDPYANCPRADIVTYIYNIKSQPQDTHTGSSSSWDQHIDRYFYIKLVGEYDNSYYTENSALKITSAAQLAAFAAFTNRCQGNNFVGKYISLENDVDLGGYQWEPIGKPETKKNSSSGNVEYHKSGGFAGTFLGNQHRISNLIIEDNSRCILGLFGANCGGKIFDIHLSGTIRGLWNVGSIAGYNNYGGIISGCSSDMNIFAAGFCAGGLVGQNTAGSAISNCSFSGSVTGWSASTGNIGGLAGFCSGGIEQSSCSGTIKGGMRVGGIAGRLQSGGYIVDCVCTGKVTGVRYYDVFVGMNDAGENNITGCTTFHES